MYAYELLMNDFVTNEALRILIEKYDVCKRTAERYIYCANVWMEEKDEKNRKRKLARYLARKGRLIRDMSKYEKTTAKGVLAVNTVLDSMAKMEGLLVDKIDVTTNGKDLNATVTIITSDGKKIQF